MILFAVLSIVTTLLLIPLLPWRVARIRVCNWFGKTLGRSVVFLAGVTPNIPERARLDASMPAIYVANHTSTLDAFISIWLCPYGACGVFKKEAARIPFFGQLLLLSGHLMLDRKNHQHAVGTLKDIAVLMRAKRLGVWIMPEGTRSKDGRLQRFKTGFVHLAIAAGIPVVPVAIHSAHRNWPLGPLNFQPMTLEIDILPAIDTSSWKEETSNEHADHVHDVLQAALRAEQQPLPLPIAA
jgi:putative phosphoserine phosphatase/1-acylglycerol-3-phosphate O-acyltransferase